ncbi:MAG TPA: TonB family protein, partial [Candidatus Saccharimonadales bacterium]|nr:TonB family protein [Candidatus Saccharimonadales bacterium]
VDVGPSDSPPESPTRLRLTIDGSGAVTGAAVQKGCGREDLDKKAVAAAMKMLFTPVRKGTLPDGSPRTFAVHLNVEARFVVTAPPSR